MAMVLLRHRSIDRIHCCKGFRCIGIDDREQMHSFDRADVGH